MKMIGLTGGIGSGKSTVARFLKKLGAEVVDLDKVGNEVIKKPKYTYLKLVREFGETILNKDGEIDRTKLGKIVFSDPPALERLNSIVHPEIDKFIVEKTKDCLHQSIEVLVLEAAAMLEAKRDWQVDEIWVTITPDNIALQRIKDRPGYGEAEAKARIRSQMTNEERIKRANVVINNDGTLDELEARVKIEWEKLIKRL